MEDPRADAYELLATHKKGKQFLAQAPRMHAPVVVEVNSNAYFLLKLLLVERQISFIVRVYFPPTSKLYCEAWSYTYHPFRCQSREPIA